MNILPCVNLDYLLNVTELKSETIFIQSVQSDRTSVAVRDKINTIVLNSQTNEYFLRCFQISNTYASSFCRKIISGIYWSND